MAEFIYEKYNNDEEFEKNLSNYNSNKNGSFLLKSEIKSEIESFGIHNRVKENEGCCWFKFIIFYKIIYFIFYNNCNIWYIY